MFGQFESIALSKKYYRNDQHLYIFTKLSQNMCLINTHIMIYQYAKCNFNLWKGIRFYCVFLVFSYITDQHLCLKCNCLTKFHRLCVWLMYTFWYVIMPNVTPGYGRFSDTIEFFENFHKLGLPVSFEGFKKVDLSSKMLVWNFRFWIFIAVMYFYMPQTDIIWTKKTSFAVDFIVRNVFKRKLYR